MTGLYGSLVTTEDVRLAVVAHLKLWSPAYLAEVERQKGASLPPFRGYVTESGDVFPVALVACAGTEGDPERHGDGTITAWWAVGAAAVVAGKTRDEANVTAGYYGAAIRASILQHPSLSGFAESIVWIGESLEEVAWDPDLSIVVCLARFLVAVPAVVNVNLGPLEPPVDPGADPGDLPTVVTVTETIIRE